MSIVQWDPWKELDQLRAHTDSLWDTFLAKLTDESNNLPNVGFLPDVDIVETAYDFRIYMSVPGLVEEDIQIETSPTTLTIRGEREPPYDLNRQHVREWRYGFFERRITVEKPTVPEEIRATYEAGVLIVVMPKQQLNETEARP